MDAAHTDGGSPAGIGDSRGGHDQAPSSDAVARFRGELLADWLPVLEGVIARLEGGARVADIRCGHGYTTTRMAASFPHSIFWGFDPHAPAIGQARENAALTAHEGRLHYAVADEADYPCAGFDLICFFDGLRDAGDPLGGARHAAQALAPGGTVVVVERSTEQGLAEVFAAAGFALVRRATRTPFNLVLEGRVQAVQQPCHEAPGADSHE